MKIEENRSLRELTTLKVGGSVAYVLTCTTLEDVESAFVFARTKHLPLVVLGEGSNVLPSDEFYSACVLRMCVMGSTYREELDGTVHATIGAGESWDSFVEEVAGRGLWGIENLAGIPGTVGASPVQNIGAYGMEVAQCIESVMVYDSTTNTHYEIKNKKCLFSYRDSRFKHEANLIITSVTFILSSHGAPRTSYSDLQTAQHEGVALRTPKEITYAVRNIRSHKFPNIIEYGTAGSFFKNPIVSQEKFIELTSNYGSLPSFPVATGAKIPLAYILDKVLAMKGFIKGSAFLFGNQPLVVVAHKGATAHDVDALAKEIEQRVYAETGIVIEREVRNISAHEVK